MQRILRFLSFHFEIILRTSDAATRYVRNTYNAHPHRRALVGQRERQREREREAGERFFNRFPTMNGRSVLLLRSSDSFSFLFSPFVRRFWRHTTAPSIFFFSVGKKERASERERERERERSKDSFRNRSLIKEKKKFRTRGENIVEDNAIDGCIPRCVFLCAFFLSLSSFSRLQRSLNPSRPRRA